MPEKISQSEWHPSQRGYFAGCLYNEMINGPDIFLIVGDLGYGVFDKIRDNFPNRFYNVGASEQAAVGICVGLALENRKPFFYSITTFLLYRCFETIRNYISHEQIAVRMVGSGRDFDYQHDGFSHHSHDAKGILNKLPHIRKLWPVTKEQIPDFVERMVKEDRPWFISLRR